MEQYISHHTPGVVGNIYSTLKTDFPKVCEHIAETSARGKTTSSLYTLGWIQYSMGAQNIRTMAMIQLLPGNTGMASGGVNALRGHSNIQGLIDSGLLSQDLPGYATLPSEKQVDPQIHLAASTLKPLLEGQVNYQDNYPKSFVSIMRAFLGDKTTAEDSWGFNWLPKWDRGYDALQYFKMMSQGKANSYIYQGLSPIASFPNKNKVVASLSKPKFLVTIDPLNTGTSTFWQNHGESDDVDPLRIQTGVFRLSSTCFAEENGSIANSGRWLQWHWKGAGTPGIVVTDDKILAGIFLHLRKVYTKQDGANPGQVLNTTWNYSTPHEPVSEEVVMESSGKALADITDPATGVVIVKKSQQLGSSVQLHDDGTTPSGCQIFAGSWTPEGNQMARRDNTDPSDLGNTLGWTWTRPLNRRILYSRASADPQGNPQDPKRQILRWGEAKWSGADTPNYSAATPGSNVGPFIMQPRGVERLFVIDKMAEDPFPEHYESSETPLETNPLHPDVISNLAARIFRGDEEALGRADKSPYVGITRRLTEHSYYWTEHTLLSAIAQPEQFMEIGEELANKLGTLHGNTVRISSNRDYIKAKVTVTKRIRMLEANDKDIDTIGIPIRWGYEGVARKDSIASTLTPFVGDANTQTPEFKSFLVDAEKVQRRRPVAYQSQDIIRRSATNGLTPALQARDYQKEAAKLIDITTYVGCEACQMACSEQNDIRDGVGNNVRVYDDPADLVVKPWTVMRFSEVEQNDKLEWSICKDGRIYCADPGCLKVCLAESAIIQYANGIVDFQSEQCIDYGYRIAGCPFDVPRLNPEDNRVYKCTLRADCVVTGQEPVCVKACPTGAIHFDIKESMKVPADKRMAGLKTHGYENADLYDPAGVGGTHVMYVLHYADEPNLYYGLPENLEISATVKFWKGIQKPLAAVGFATTSAASIFHYVGVSLNRAEEEEDGLHEKDDEVHK